MPFVSPCASVNAAADCSAFTSTVPVTFSAAPPVIAALVFTFEITTAIAGATVTLPPNAPVFAVVVSECVVVARTVTLRPPVS